MDNKDTVINIDHKLANAIREKLSSVTEKQMSPQEPFTIFKVPGRIRRGKEIHYEPSFISIGPYHHGKKQLQSTQEQKWRQLQDFLARNTHNSLEVYINNLRGLEARARSCYFDHIDLTSEQFVEMLLLDSCFIIEFLLKFNQYYVPNYSSATIPICSWFYDQILEDLIVLENQIPFFVVQSMFELVYNRENWSKRPAEVADMAARYLASINLSKESECPATCKTDVINHLLHLYYKSVVPPGNLTQSNHKSLLGQLKVLLKKWLNPLKLIIIAISYWKKIDHGSTNQATTATSKIPCASTLVEAGVKFKKRTGTTLMDIAFNDGVLEIPPIMIGDNTKTCMFNMVALEQFSNGENTLSTYAQFMDFIIDTPKDVEILQECGIVESYQKSNEEVALFFNQLNDYVFVHPDYHYLDSVSKQIIEFSESDWYKNRARLMRDYFSNPWSILSLIAAIVLLILTFLQTFFAIYSYFHPK